MNNPFETTFAPTPGDFDCRSGDCAEHGANVPHARVKRTDGQFYCVRCLCRVAAEQVFKASEFKS